METMEHSCTSLLRLSLLGYFSSWGQRHEYSWGWGGGNSLCRFNPIIGSRHGIIFREEQSSSRRGSIAARLWYRGFRLNWGGDHSRRRLCGSVCEIKWFWGWQCRNAAVIMCPDIPGILLTEDECCRTCIRGIWIDQASRSSHGGTRVKLSPFRSRIHPEERRRRHVFFAFVVRKLIRINGLFCGLDDKLVITGPVTE